MLEVNRRIAYKSATGRRREAFCQAYTEEKKTNLQNMHESLSREVTSGGKTISCAKGCSHCCKLFVVASLQECEAIVYHLYHHEAALKVFLRNFPRWNERILRIERSFRNMNELHSRITAGQASEGEIKQFDAECDTYALQDIPCPFLLDNACAIYETRPYVCARVIAVTPSDWCRAGHPRQAEALLFKAQVQFEKDMPYFIPLASDCVFSSMPFMVYRLLREGYDALETVPGLEKIKNTVFSDPEVQAEIK